jgi:hypothetical protein
VLKERRWWWNLYHIVVSNGMGNLGCVSDKDLWQYPEHSASHARISAKYPGRYKTAGPMFHAGMVLSPSRVANLSRNKDCQKLEN